MVARFQLLSVLLVCFWLELDSCSAFPRGWQVAREEQDAYDFGNRHFVQAQANHQLNSEPRPWGPPWAHSSRAQIQHQPSLYPQAPSLNQPPQPQPQVPKSQGFQFNFQLPMVDAQSQSKENTSSAPAASNPRPSSIQVQSSFNSPSVLNRFLGQSGGKKPHDDSKPSFGLSLSLPVSPTNPPSNPSSNSAQSGTPESDRWPEDVNAERRVVTFSPEQDATLPTPERDPAGHVWVHTPYPASPVHSWQPENRFTPANIPAVYHYWRDQSGQMASPSPNNAYLSLAPWQYVVPSRPSATNYGAYKICHLDGSPLTLAEQRDLFLQTYDWQVPAASQRPALQPYAALPHQPSFDYGKVSNTANYQTANVMPVRETGFFSSHPHQYSLGQSGQDAVPPVFGLTQNYEVPVGNYPLYHGPYYY